MEIFNTKNIFHWKSLDTDTNPKRSDEKGKCFEIISNKKFKISHRIALPLL